MRVSTAAVLEVGRSQRTQLRRVGVEHRARPSNVARVPVETSNPDRHHLERERGGVRVRAGVELISLSSESAFGCAATTAGSVGGKSELLAGLRRW
jgi:hypothetical protein